MIEGGVEGRRLNLNASLHHCTTAPLLPTDSGWQSQSGCSLQLGSDRSQGCACA